MATYLQGVKNGDVREYYENGALHRESHYKNGQKVGFERSYDTNGALSTEFEYIQGIPAQVKVTWFYPDGKVKMQMLYEDNQALWQRSYNKLGEISAKLDCKAENCLSGLSQVRAQMQEE